MIYLALLTFFRLGTLPILQIWPFVRRWSLPVYDILVSLYSTLLVSICAQNCLPVSHNIVGQSVIAVVPIIPEIDCQFMLFKLGYKSRY